MKKHPLLVLTALCAFFFGGCASVTKGLQDQSSLVQAIIDANFPADFNGPAELHVKDMYLTLDIVAVGLRKDSALNRWVWQGVKIDRVRTIPWFAGLTYTLDIHIKEGTGVP